MDMNNIKLQIPPEFSITLFWRDGDTESHGSLERRGDWRANGGWRGITEYAPPPLDIWWPMSETDASICAVQEQSTGEFCPAVSVGLSPCLGLNKKALEALNPQNGSTNPCLSTL